LILQLSKSSIYSTKPLRAARALHLAQQATLPGRVPENRQSGLVLYAGGDTFDSALPSCRLQLIAPREHRICTGRELHAQKNHPKVVSRHCLLL
ncbi:hypothetical protein, partial [Escherichia coli]|uniref:hypothetical protein n=1 Tax=Escherichia coli TaxID=562 RepID=UPI001951645F